MSLTFIVGTAADVFGEDLARVVDGALRKHFDGAGAGDEPYHSEPVDASGWRLLQQRVMRTLDTAPQLTTIDAYQAVWIPGDVSGVDHLAIANLADPLQVGSLKELLDELHRFAAAASLPTDDVELMQLAAHYLESDDFRADLDVQTFVQVLLSARQASVRQQPLWVVL